MQLALTVAFLAAATSIIGTLATLFIAKKSRDSGRELILLKAEIDRSTERANLLRGIEAESERLRVRCWEMLGYLSGGSLSSAQKEFDSIVTRFLDQANVFADRWADAKPEIPDSLVKYIRAIRHACRTHILVIRRSCLNLDSSSTSLLRNRLHILLDQLEHFEFVVAMVRGSRTEAEYNLVLQSLPSLESSMYVGESHKDSPEKKLYDGSSRHTN